MRYTKVADWNYIASVFDAQRRAVAAPGTREAEEREAELAVEAAGIAEASAAAAVGTHGSVVGASGGRKEEEAETEEALEGGDVDGDGPIPVIGNGDVLSYLDWNRHLADPRICTCMIARGALIKVRGGCGCGVVAGVWGAGRGHWGLGHSRQRQGQAQS